MNRIATLPPPERAVVLREGAARLGYSAVVVEKDFWVCWILGLLFQPAELAGALVFKGGTSLSKVYHAINRFSEDIDLSVAPHAIGLSEDDLLAPASNRARDAKDRELEARCIAWTQATLAPILENEIEKILGPRDDGTPWLVFARDSNNAPVLWFRYPPLFTDGAAYIRREIKLEPGSLTDQRPVGEHQISPWLANVVPKPLSEMYCRVVSLEAERTFWEKATLLHAEYHRALDVPMPANYSRHYSDIASLVRNRPLIVEAALADPDFCQRVAAWKTRFFTRAWARYDLARPRTLRLVPPPERHAELEKDYRDMGDMFLHPPPAFEEVLATIRDLELRINQ